MKKSLNLLDMFGPKVTEDRSLCKKHRREIAENINDKITIYNDDCVQILKGLDDDSISCCVTDPPYHLTSSKKSKKGFMGQKWDGGNIAFSLALWKELFRVLKPGAHLLAFGSPRTSHKMVYAIEMAGFDIRDSIMWIYAQGLTHRFDVSKAIDKKYGAIRKVVGIKSSGIGSGKFHAFSGKDKNTEAKKEVDITIPASAMAEYWEGWDGSLKPSHEPIVVARKPLGKGMTIAQNVLTYGTGAINAGDCSIENTDKKTSNSSCSGNLGRYPLNTIISEEVSIDLGRYAKFFYCPKPNKEKHQGCEHLAPKKDADNSGKPKRKKGNTHPTVKPISLMEYLAKLVTPPSGICIDPFMGSGSTGIACSNLGFSFIGIEQDKNYYEIAKARINYSINNKKAA